MRRHELESYRDAILSGKVATWTVSPVLERGGMTPWQVAKWMTKVLREKEQTRGDQTRFFEG